MFYILLGFTWVASIVMHALILQLPRFLQKSWRLECIEYLQSTHTLVEYSTPPLSLSQKIHRNVYLPFFSLRFLVFDVLLFASTISIFFHFNNFLYWGSALLFTWLLITSSAIDYEHQILPDELTYCLLWLGLACNCWNLFASITSAIFGAIVAYLMLFTVSVSFKLIRKKEGIGQGDLKLFAAIIAWTGIFYIPFVILISALSSILFIVLRNLISGKAFNTPAPFGPFLALSGWIVLLWGNAFLTFFISR